jgi:hypothetical protein
LSEGKVIKKQPMQNHFNAFISLQKLIYLLKLLCQQSESLQIFPLNEHGTLATYLIPLYIQRYPAILENGERKSQVFRSHLKIKILVQNQGGAEF